MLGFSFCRYMNQFYHCMYYQYTNLVSTLLHSNTSSCFLGLCINCYRCYKLCLQILFGAIDCSSFQFYCHNDCNPILHCLQNFNVSTFGKGFHFGPYLVRTFLFFQDFHQLHQFGFVFIENMELKLFFLVHSINH